MNAVDSDCSYGRVRGDDGGGVVAQDVADVGRQEAAFEAVGEDRPEVPGVVLRQRIGRRRTADGRDAGLAIDLAGRDRGRRGAVTEHQERPRVGDDLRGPLPRDIRIPLVVVAQQRDLTTGDAARRVHPGDGQVGGVGHLDARPGCPAR